MVLFECFSKKNHSLLQGVICISWTWQVIIFRWNNAYCICSYRRFELPCKGCQKFRFFLNNLKLQSPTDITILAVCTWTKFKVAFCYLQGGQSIQGNLEWCQGLIELPRWLKFFFLQDFIKLEKYNTVDSSWIVEVTKVSYCSNSLVPQSLATNLDLVAVGTIIHRGQNISALSNT